MMDQTPVINQSKRTTRATRLAAGLCENCGTKPLSTTYHCADCAKYFADYAREKRAKKRAEFLAIHGADGRTLRAQKIREQPTRRCRVCEKYKPKEEFYANGSGSLARKTICKTCDSTRADAWAKANPEKRSKTYRRRHLKRAYEMTEEQYAEMLKYQNGGCAICQKKEQDARGGRLCVDHDHATLKIRGLLCGECNTALGNFHDDASLLLKAADYLSENNR